MLDDERLARRFSWYHKKLHESIGLAFQLIEETLSSPQISRAIFDWKHRVDLRGIPAGGHKDMTRRAVEDLLYEDVVWYGDFLHTVERIMKEKPAAEPMAEAEVEAMRRQVETALSLVEEISGNFRRKLS